MRRLTQVLIAGAISIMPLAILTGCGLQCHGCKETATSALLMAANYDDIKYTDCAGPGAIFRCGLNTVCWPTECVFFKLQEDEETEINGKAIYYHGCGSIDSASVKSLGMYTVGGSLCDINSGGYVECASEKDGKTTIKAYNKPDGCLGWMCMEEETPMNANFGYSSPSLLNGCW